MILSNRSRLTSALRNRRQKKAAIQSRRSQKSARLTFEHLERRNLLATFVVNSAVDDASGTVDGQISLREAIVAANTNAAFGDAQAGDENGDTIVFDGPISELTHTLLNGELVITDDLVITGSEGNVTIDAANASRIFNINTIELVALNNLTLTNGTADIGGAVLSEAGGTTRFTNVTLTDNTATADEASGGGGGVYTAIGNFFATGLVATGNVASGIAGSGGAIFQASGNVSLFDAVVDSNIANRAGGGIEVVDGSFFANNITLGTEGAGNIAGPEGSAAPGNGGGFHISGIATASFVGGSVQGNFAANEGGGLWNQVGSRLFVSDVEITQNVAAGDDADTGGGGIFNNGGVVQIVGETVIDANSATGAAGSGGGILSVDGSVIVINSDVIGNSANRAGGGIELIDGTLVARDSSFVSNIAGPAGSAAPGNGGAFHVSGIASSRFIGGDVTGNIAANEGGGLWNQAGSNLFVSGVDISGNIAQGNAAANGGGGIFNNGGDVLIVDVESFDNNEASGAAGSGGAILSVDGTVFIRDSEISNNSANRAGGAIEIIDGTLDVRDTSLTSNIAGPAGSAAPGNGGAFHVSGVASSSFIGGEVFSNTAANEGGGLWNQVGSSLFVSDVLISGNNALGDGAANGGGGIFNNGGTVRIANETNIEANNASGEAGSGGGILSVDGQITVINSSISTNSANRAGGGIEIINGRLVVRNSELSDNIAGPEGSASPGNGGGFHVSGNEASAFFQASTISGNVAAAEGGGLWNQAGSFLRVDGNSVIQNNTASGDDADNGGGGIFNNGGRVSVINSTIEGNSADGELGSGGGLFSVASDIFVSGSVISENVANRAGGGFEIVDGRLDVLASTLDGNSAGSETPESAAPGNGGAFHVTGTESTAVFRDSLISNNSAALEGGGLWNQAGSTLIVTGSTVRDNTAEGDAADAGGGGIYNNGGNVTINNSFINLNSATGESGSGGGLFSVGGQVLINDTSINDNTANRAGGGIEVIDGFNRLENTIVNRNEAGGDAANPGNGGGVHVSGSESQFAIIDSTFIGNIASNEGGALWNQAGSLMSIRGTTRVNVNVSDGDGGGVYNRGRLLAQDALFTANTAELDGGGIFTTETGETFLTGVSVLNNSADTLGGGLANFGNLAVVDSVFENNFANNGGAIAAIEGVTSQARNSFAGNNPNNIFRA